MTATMASDETIREHFAAFNRYMIEELRYDIRITNAHLAVLNERLAGYERALAEIERRKEDAKLAT